MFCSFKVLFHDSKQLTININSSSHSLILRLYSLYFSKKTTLPLQSKRTNYIQNSLPMLYPPSYAVFDPSSCALFFIDFPFELLANAPDLLLCPAGDKTFLFFTLIFSISFPLDLFLDFDPPLCRRRNMNFLLFREACSFSNTGAIKFL